SLLGFKVKLNILSVPLFALAVPMLFSNRGKLRYWAEFLIGFAILFLGLSFLKEAVPDLRGNTDALEFLSGFAGGGFLSRVFFVMVGALVTIIVQSSSAAMAITLTMCAQGWLPFEVAAAMILGENIGTTITAELASLVGNVSAKRSARIHSMFNIIGVVWMLILMPYFLPFLSSVVQNLFGISDPFTNPDDMPIGLSAFHTAFNLTNVILLIGFVPWLVKGAIYSVKSKGKKDEKFRLRFISTERRTPELATVELQKETAHFGEVTSQMNDFTRELINAVESKPQQKMLKKIKKYEGITDKMEIEITEYITNLAGSEITPTTSLRLRSILNICNDLERIGDIYFQISKNLERKIEERLYFTPDQRNGLNEMLDFLDDAFTEMNRNLALPSYNQASIDRANELAKQIKKHRETLVKSHLTRLGDEDYNVGAAMIYNTIFSSMGRVGAHIINVSESIIGEI
ncbi:MAG: Na/Pi cotransporter family protein, partial [Saprospiraceae bacterium]|nr:Na/Pi cotransporter family protein [Saprospiraceae bacterium]